MIQKPSVIFEGLNARELSRSKVKLSLHLGLVRLLLEYYLVLVSTLQMDIDELKGIQRRAKWMLAGLENVACYEDSGNSSYHRKIRWWPDGSLSMVAGERGQAEGINLIRFWSVTKVKWLWVQTRKILTKNEVQISMTVQTDHWNNFIRAAVDFLKLNIWNSTLNLFFLRRRKKKKRTLGHALGIKMSSVICSCAIHVTVCQWDHFCPLKSMNLFLHTDFGDKIEPGETEPECQVKPSSSDFH